jgi:molybdate transport system substrate-binding protein
MGSCKNFPKKYMKKIYLLFFCLFLITSTVHSLQKTTLTIAIASNFESTFKALQPVFEKQYPIKLDPVFGSTGKLYTQIINGAPFDLFLSGDQAHVRLLEGNQLSSPRNHFVYANGTLVMYAPGKQISNQGLTHSMTQQIKRIAIANPSIAPYGLAAMQYLRHEHLWNKLKDRTVMGDSIGQVYTFLITRNAEVGFIAKSQQIDILKHARSHIVQDELWTVPQSMYKPLKQYATLINASHSPKKAELFLAFLKTPTAKKIIVENGYHF